MEGPNKIVDKETETRPEIVIGQEHLRFAEKIKATFLRTLLSDDDFLGLVDCLKEYYSSCGNDVFNFQGDSLDDLLLIRTSQTLAEKGNDNLDFYINDIRDKVLEINKDNPEFGVQQVIEKLKDSNFDTNGLKICNLLFNLHAKNISFILEGVEEMAKAVTFTLEDNTSKLWFGALMVEIDPEFKEFYERIKKYPPEKIRRIVCHPRFYDKLKAKFIKFQYLYQNKLASLSLQNLEGIINRVHFTYDPRTHISGEIGSQLTLQTTAIKGPLLYYVGAKLNSTTNTMNKSNTQNTNALLTKQPEITSIDKVFDQIIANSGYINQPENPPKDLDEIVPPPEDSENEKAWLAYMERLQTLADNFEEIKVKIEAGLSLKTVIGRIEHEKAVHRVYRAIEIIVREMGIEGATISTKVTITNPSKPDKENNYRTDLVLILPNRDVIILEAKNTAGLYGKAVEQVGVYAGAGQASGKIWIGDKEIEVGNIHTATVFAGNSKEIDSQIFIKSQKAKSPDQILILDDPNWVWNLINLIRNKGLLNQENISTTRSTGFTVLKKKEPTSSIQASNNNQELFQKVWEKDVQYRPEQPKEQISILENPPQPTFGPKFLEKLKGKGKTPNYRALKTPEMKQILQILEKPGNEHYNNAFNRLNRYADRLQGYLNKKPDLKNITTLSLHPILNFSESEITSREKSTLKELISRAVELRNIEEEEQINIDFKALYGKFKNTGSYLEAYINNQSGISENLPQTMVSTIDTYIKVGRNTSIFENIDALRKPLPIISNADSQEEFKIKIVDYLVSFTNVKTICYSLQSATYAIAASLLDEFEASLKSRK